MKQQPGAHSLLDTRQAELPLWLNEGLTKLTSTIEVVRGTARIGNPVGPHLLWLRSRGLIPRDELFATHRSSPGAGTRLTACLPAVEGGGDEHGF